MKNSRLNYKVEVEGILPQLDRAQFNFTLLAGGVIRTDELQEEILRDLATLALLKEDLNILKDEMGEETNETHCPDCAHKQELIEIKNETIGLMKEKINEYQEKCSKLTDENIRLCKELDAIATKKEAEVCNK